jgi:alpha-tubulin suppressor-like RCC1 family protein
MTRVTRRFRGWLHGHRMPIGLVASFIAMWTIAFAAPPSASAEEKGEGASKSVVPEEVKNVSGATAIAAGRLFGLAALSDGRVMSWGNNRNGALGDGNETSTTEPVQVKNLSEATAVAGGNGFGLALLKTGKVMAWGEGGGGQLGDGTFSGPERCHQYVEQACATTPVQVKGLSEVTAIAAGGDFGLALLKDGKVMAWGQNNWGQLGDGNETSTDEPVEVKNLSEVTAIAAGEAHSLALLKDGKVMAWGENVSGQLGDGTSYNGPEHCGLFEDNGCAKTPVEVKNLSEAAAIASGPYSDSFAVRKDGTAMGWGFNRDGQLGDGNEISTDEPVQVKNLSEATAIAAGLQFSLALRKDGRAMAWGANSEGQLGDGNETETHEPVQVRNLSEVTAIAAGVDYGLALLADGKVMSWGANWTGQLGDGNAPTGRPTVEQRSPRQGLASGGTLVTITGTDLAGAEAVDFGATPGTIKSDSEKSITVEAPSGIAGRTVNITVTTNRGTSKTGYEDYFKYVNVIEEHPFPPYVTAVSPGEGPEAGGTTVTITGRNLNGATAVKFGTHKSTSFYETRTGEEVSIIAVAPPGAGNINVSVTTPEGDSPHVAEDKFTYFPPPSNSSLPYITGKPEVGQTLSEHPATWTLHPFSYNYQWLQCNALGESCVAIQNATGQTYVPQISDVGHKLEVEERAFNGGWSNWAISLPTGVVIL